MFLPDKDEVVSSNLTRPTSNQLGFSEITIALKKKIQNPPINPLLCQIKYKYEEGKLYQDFLA